jgi:hypothetical protein
MNLKKMEKILSERMECLLNEKKINQKYNSFKNQTEAENWLMWLAISTLCLNKEQLNKNKN